MSDIREERLEALEAEVARLRSRLSRGRYAMVLAGVLALTATGTATALNGAPLLLGHTGNEASNETGLVSTAATYALRATNARAGDGGALGAACSAGASAEPCVAAVNSGTGRAFEFFARGRGGEVGRITTGHVNARPFTTNATGVATGLNADRVDGKDAAEITGVLGGGEFGGVCFTEIPCQLERNQNVTSVRRGGWTESSLCIKVAGADPQRDFMHVSPLGYVEGGRFLTGASLAMLTEMQGEPQPRLTPFCDSDEFTVTTWGIKPLGHWGHQLNPFSFVVLRGSAPAS